MALEQGAHNSEIFAELRELLRRRNSVKLRPERGSFNAYDFMNVNPDELNPDAAGEFLACGRTPTGPTDVRRTILRIVLWVN
jgi:hypothetical protein